jgi:predicted TIM-barrel fold metal-dependent hydrolase
MMKQTRIIDCHTHMPSIGWEKPANFFPSVQEAVNYLRSSGIEKAIFNTWRGVLSGTREDLEKGNAEALEMAALTKGFLYPGVAMNPDFPEESLKWLSKFHELGYRWAGELLTYKIDTLKSTCKYTDPRFVKLIERCVELKFIVQIHIEPEIVDLAKMFPGLTIVCSHIGEDDFLKRLVKCDNIYLDISGMSGGLIVGRLEKTVEILGANRLLFGSDFTGYEPQAFIARVKKAIPDHQEQQNVFYNNVSGLLKSVGVTI